MSGDVAQGKKCGVAGEEEGVGGEGERGMAVGSWAASGMVLMHSREMFKTRNWRE